MRILDLFCGAGGAAVGYHDAGFDVVGIDLHAQRRFPFEFGQAEALHAMRVLLRGGRIGRHRLDDFDAIHASPPCQAFSQATRTAPGAAQRVHLNLIPGTRELLLEAGLPYVIENVETAREELRSPQMLCGSTVGLHEIERHRLFETNWPLVTPPCDHSVYEGNAYPANRSGRSTKARVISVAGHQTLGVTVDDWRRAMGIDWMTRDELAQAIPPAYTRLIGNQLLDHIAALYT